MSRPAQPALSAGLLLAALLGSTVPAQAQLVASKGYVSVASGVDDVSVLRGAQATDAERFEAAKRLVLKADETSDAGLLAALRDGASPAGQAAVARAILAVDPGSPRFARALRDALGSATTAPCVSDLLTALDHYPVRPTVAVAVERLMSDNTADDVRTLLCAAVYRWTACAPGATPGADRAAWERWWTRVQPLDEAGWSAELARNFRTRAERAVAERERLETRVLDLSNALYAATPAERRGQVIAMMLQDDLPKVQRLGLDLASRTLLNAQPLGPDVAAAAVALLRREHEDIRAAAARLVENLGAVSDHAAIAESLANEESPRVAGPLLRLSARTPGALPAGVLLRWLSAPEPAGSAAAEAVLTLRAADLLPEAAARDALSTVLGLDPATMTGAQARLLASLGGPNDRAAIRMVAQRSSSTTARRSAGLALAANEEELRFLLAGAKNDAALFEGAARAVALHRPRASAMLELLAAAPADASWIEPAANALLALPPDQRLSVLRAIDAPTKRDALVDATLSRLAPAEGRELLLLQAESRLERGDAEGALAAATSALRDAPGGLARAEHARFYALVALGRLDDAVAVTPSDAAACWLEALRRCSDLPHATTALALVESRYLEAMTEEQRGSLEALRTRIAARATTPRAPETGGRDVPRPEESPDAERRSPPPGATPATGSEA